MHDLTRLACEHASNGATACGAMACAASHAQVNKVKSKHCRWGACGHLIQVYLSSIHLRGFALCHTLDCLALQEVYLIFLGHSLSEQHQWQGLTSEAFSWSRSILFTVQILPSSQSCNTSWLALLVTGMMLAAKMGGVRGLGCLPCPHARCVGVPKPRVVHTMAQKVGSMICVSACCKRFAPEQHICSSELLPN